MSKLLFQNCQEITNCLEITISKIAQINYFLSYTWGSNELCYLNFVIRKSTLLHISRDIYPKLRLFQKFFFVIFHNILSDCHYSDVINILLNAFRLKKNLCKLAIEPRHMHLVEIISFSLYQVIVRPTKIGRIFRNQNFQK